jgi:hypothetical protein
MWNLPDMNSHYALFKHWNQLSHTVNLRMQFTRAENHGINRASVPPPDSHSCGTLAPSPVSEGSVILSQSDQLLGLARLSRRTQKTATRTIAITAATLIKTMNATKAGLDELPDAELSGTTDVADAVAVRDSDDAVGKLAGVGVSVTSDGKREGSG